MRQKGKTEENLIESRIIRTRVLRELGIQNIPESILIHDRADKALDLMAEKRSYTSTSLGHLAEDRRMQKIFSASGMSCRGKDGALSRFPQNIGRVLVKFYCPESGTVYDPFAGHNSRMELVCSSGRNYIGVDISDKFMKANREILNILKSRQNNSLFGKFPCVRLIKGSSASVPFLADNSADFTITSPPYWDLEFYGNEAEQLGKNKTYELFLQAIFLHIKENLRILKPGSFCIWCINDFTKDKVFYPYHSDIMQLFVKAGFTIFNVYIIDLGSSITSAFTKYLLQIKRFPKRHEYCIVGQKPGVNPLVENHIKQLGDKTE